MLVWGPGEECGCGECVYEWYTWVQVLCPNTGGRA